MMMILSLEIGFIGKLYYWDIDVDSCLDWVQVILCYQVKNQNGLSILFVVDDITCFKNPKRMLVEEKLVVHLIILAYKDKSII